MTKITKNVSVMCFHDELYQVLWKEGAQMLACPLNVPLFGMSESNFVDGVKLANPATYYKEIVVPADMNLTF